LHHGGTEGTEEYRKKGKDMLENEQITDPVIGAAIEVHRHLGPRLLESVYERCLCRELELRGIAHLRQVLLPVTYKGQIIDCDLRMDIVLPGLVLELKSVEKLLPIHEAQLLTYLKLSGNKIGLLINFNVPKLRDGLKRMVN
jgi:GxxExxY protein